MTTTVRDMRPNQIRQKSAQSVYFVVVSFATQIWLFSLHTYPVLYYTILDFNRTAATGEDSMNYLESGRLTLMLDRPPQVAASGCPAWPG